MREQAGVWQGVLQAGRGPGTLSSATVVLENILHSPWQDPSHRLTMLPLLHSCWRVKHCSQDPWGSPTILPLPGGHSQG